MTEIEGQIAAEIRVQGAISFSRFMELALYCPVYGFYEKEADTIGRHGQFFTSVSVGPLFGELLGFTFSGWLDEIHDGGRNPMLVEAGAHDGKLALDILGWFERYRPDLYHNLRYLLVEPSARRAAWQRERLQPHAPHVFWVADVCGLHNQPAAGDGVQGIIFSNELLDAFPAHRLAWRRLEQRWVECAVSLGRKGFEWTHIEKIAPELRALLPAADDPILRELPDGYIVEVSPAAVAWWTSAARALRSGLLLTFDYGLASEDRFLAERTSGTLRAYRAHACTDRVLESPGEQDLTAHVSFPNIIEAGEKEGLTTVTFEAQGRFLSRLATRIPPEHGFAPPWDFSRNRQFATLTHPEHLGHSFKVLVQARPCLNSAGAP